MKIGIGLSLWARRVVPAIINALTFDSLVTDFSRDTLTFDRTL